MTRKGEIGRTQIKRNWPHWVELSGEAVRGENTALTWDLAKELGAAPQVLSLASGPVMLQAFWLVRNTSMRPSSNR